MDLICHHMIICGKTSPALFAHCTAHFLHCTHFTHICAFTRDSGGWLTVVPVGQSVRIYPPLPGPGSIHLTPHLSSHSVTLLGDFFTTWEFQDFSPWAGFPRIPSDRIQDPWKKGWRRLLLYTLTHTGALTSQARKHSLPPSSLLLPIPHSPDL